jgi:lysophospholipase L1-like esterase
MVQRGTTPVAGRRSWSVTVAAAVAVLALLAGLVGAAPAGAAGEAYVALGDSYTAGPLIPNQSLSPLGCLRSDHNYPRATAAALALTIRDVSCSGARTDHMTAPQSVDFGPNPPQFDALGTTTRIVSIGIGGNDIGFSEIIQSCATYNPFGSPCRDRYVVNGVDTITQRINATAPKVAAVLQGIRARSPQARIYLVGYPTVLPDSGLGCWPSMPIAWNDVGYLRSKTRQLNSMLAGQAAANGAFYVDTYTPSIGRDACASSTTRWVEPIVPVNPAAPVHPNARGMAGMGSVLTARINATGGR